MKLELKGITKKFGPLVANDHIDLVVEPGQIHALLGENGAGKSTLMNVLYGIYQADEGEIFIDDQPVKFKGPGDAVAAGIGMVHQHFMLIPVFTVAESVALGYEPTGLAGKIKLDAARQRVLELSKRFGFNIDPDAQIEDLPVGAQQRVEIIKALSRDAKVLILDEPTAVLTPQETDELLEIMRQLKAQGTSIVLITHKLREVKAIADTVTVIRRGKVVGTADPSESASELAAKMVGRAVDLGVKKSAPQIKPGGLEIKDLTVLNENQQRVIDDFSLQVQAGEIVCIAGVQGNGQTELADVLLGRLPITGGSISVDGQNFDRLTIKKRLRFGMGFVPEDRSKDGMIADFTIAENMILDVYDSSDFSSHGSLKLNKIYQHAKKLQERFDVRVTSLKDPISTLSGGNAQKVILSRELSRPLKLLVINQPTRGLDVGSIEFVHAEIVAERDKGTPVLVISTELDEVVALADRIAVMYHGKLMGVVASDTPRNILGLMMAGMTYQQALAKENQA